MGGKAMKGARMQQYAIGLEHDLCKEYECERFGIGGIANSDHIRRVGFYHSMAMVLVKYYYGDNREKIDRFLDSTSYYAGKRMDDIKLEEVEKILDEYNELYKLLRAK